MTSPQLRGSGKAGSTSKEQPASLFDAGRRDFASGRLAVAEKQCRQVLEADPVHAGALHLLGLIYAQTDRVDLAIELIARAIRNDQANPDYFADLGMLLARREQLEEALKSYDLALKLKPDSAAIWVRLGDLLQRQQRYQEALLTYDHALTLAPGHAEAASKAGLLLLGQERFAEALARFELSDTVRPGQTETLHNKGLCLTRLARLEEGAASYRKLLEIDADHYETLNNLGVVLIDLGQFEEAVVHLRKAIRLKPDVVAAFSNLGIALLALERFDEVVATLDGALALAPGLAELHNNKGTALKGLERIGEALASFDRAIALRPDYASAHNNRGICLEDLMRHGEAMSSFKTALVLQPDYGDAHWNLAVNRLRAGDFKAGWVEHEWRWKAASLRLKARQFDQPLWLGAEPVEGRVLLLHNDQGFGDAIQFCRYIPQLAARGARVILEADKPLKDLFSGMAGISQCLVKGDPLPDFDLHCPLSSLPLAFDTTLATIPSAVPYLSAGASPRDWTAWLGPTRPPRVGLVWSGNPDHKNDHNRSLPLQSLLPLLDVDAQFVSLQKNVRASDRLVLCERGYILDAGPELSSFADTASLIQRLDLVISVDTSVAHLAGSLGKPVWILLPCVPDYRWLLDRSDSPWYPTARLFRQSETRQWGEVVRQAREVLLRFAGEVGMMR
jgi:tetratricopeptide (TPR) repeat protein